MVQPAVGQVGGLLAAGSAARSACGGRESLVEVKVCEALVEFLQRGDHGQCVPLGASDGESAQVPADVLAHLAQRAPLVALVNDAPGGMTFNDGDDLGEAGAWRDGSTVVGGNNVSENPTLMPSQPVRSSIARASAASKTSPLPKTGISSRSLRRAISSQWACPA